MRLMAFSSSSQSPPSTYPQHYLFSYSAGDDGSRPDRLSFGCQRPYHRMLELHFDSGVIAIVLGEPGIIRDPSLLEGAKETGPHTM